MELQARKLSLLNSCPQEANRGECVEGSALPAMGLELPSALTSWASSLTMSTESSAAEPRAPNVASREPLHRHNAQHTAYLS